MQQTIVSNRNTTGVTRKRKKMRNGMLIGIGLLLIFGLAAYLLKLHLLFFIPFAFLVLYFRSLWIQDHEHFHAYINGPLLCLDFRDTQEATNSTVSHMKTHNCHLDILLNSVSRDTSYMPFWARRRN